ncbi:MAG TPA: glycosyl hydrolase [Lachnospiraceae bacterium]|nr:glycosyl hydrolase [Lachnospiraceae bacterium]
METKKVILSKENSVPFHNQVDYCVGTGRMGLALQKEYQNQLALVQQMIGFKHIRGHGLFCDDMAIYQEREIDGKRIVEYNYTYLDIVMDSYQELGLKPFLELGFMPSKMASGTQTIFYWKGNTTPPKSYDSWKELIQTLLYHLIDRYGKEEVLTWPIEVWNEPNLPGFWEHADMKEYFKLFENSFTAIKEVDQSFRVGGPAVCGGSDEVWIKAFMEFCHEKKLAIDFVTRHHYTTEFPKPQGHYGYAELSQPEDGFTNLHTTREIIDSFPEYKGLQIHITEYNTSYIPNCPLHDTNQNAAYIANQLSRLGEDNESYSYWTFGDIFEEHGVPFTPFHGGFGLVANGCIPKPTFWSFVFFKWLKNTGGKCIYRDNHTVVILNEDGSYKGIAWNHTTERKGNTFTMEYSFNLEEKEYCFLQQRVDEDTCNPLKVWHDLGEPANPSKAQTELLKQVAKPFVTTEHINGKSETMLSIHLPENAVVYFDLLPAKVKSDNGYDYNRVMQYDK